MPAEFCTVGKVEDGRTTALCIKEPEHDGLCRFTRLPYWVCDWPHYCSVRGCTHGIGKS